jgi:anaerobic magnesium-protoporphyrin IX monomethyl ester cyclase
VKVLLINPPYQTLTSNWGVGHQIPLGLLMVGGPLLDAGHRVGLLDAECLRLRMKSILRAVATFHPDLVMTGHAGSTPAHPVCMELLRALKAAFPHVRSVYGGVYPTYHAEEILAREPAVDAIVRGEGEATAAELVEALAAGRRRGRPLHLEDAPLAAVAGLAYRSGGQVLLTPDRAPVHDLDACRVGWELIEDWSRYRCFGLGRAAIVQFSRGCPHRCTYCGQHGFWVRWRHRDPVRLVEEIAWLHRTHGIRLLTLADENPTTLRAPWQRFLDELAARRLPVFFFATIRATDIVRDADILDLYRRAGILYVLMGIESTDGEVLRQVRKGSTPRDDYRACRLLKEHGIFSVMGHIVGLGDESWGTLRRARLHLSRYDGDWLNAMYVTPHDWTPFGRVSRDRAVVEPDQRKWDYRHQVLAERRLRPWQLFAGVKWLELWFHLRPRRLWAMLCQRDRFRRRQLLWVLFHIGLVWVGEVLEFLRDAFTPRYRGKQEATVPAGSFVPPAEPRPVDNGEGAGDDIALAQVSPPGSRGRQERALAPEGKRSLSVRQGDALASVCQPECR